MKKVKTATQKITRYPDESVNKKPALDYTDSIVKRREDIQRAIDNYLPTVEQQLEKATKFYKDVDTIEKWAPKVEKALEKEEPISKEPEEILKELKRLEVF